MVAIDHDLRSPSSEVRPHKGSRPAAVLAQAMKLVQTAANAEPQAAQPGPLSSRTRTFARGVGLASMHLLDASRRVDIRACVASHDVSGIGAAGLSTYLYYLKRQATIENAVAARMFDSRTDWVDDEPFAERCNDDRYHIRFVVSPEDAGAMTDLRAFARGLLADMERDLGSRLDWIAVNHYDSDQPHVHVLVRGKAEDGRDLVICRDYIERSMRRRAEAIVAAELGPKRDADLRAALEREADAEYWTRLDAVIRRYAEAGGVIDLQPASAGEHDQQAHRLMMARLRHLERMGLAQAAGQNQWVMEGDARSTLHRLGMRRKIRNAMRRALMERGIARADVDYAIHDRALPPIIGRLVAAGLHDELTGEACVIVDGTDGRVHHIRFLDVETLKYAPIGAIAEVHRLDLEEGGRSRLAVSVLSELPIEDQVKAAGVTWLDGQAVARAPAELAEHGFGREVRTALAARIEHLVDQGLALWRGRRVAFARSFIELLRQSGIDVAVPIDAGAAAADVTTANVTTGKRGARSGVVSLASFGVGPAQRRSQWSQGSRLFTAGGHRPRSAP
jgi:type IV secretory pathway VirD2 relaxase